ncbi:hypothetical protein DEO72_LG11g1202 [Vigna unguiculata]|uniref:Uncharacterized protein n=1 Tax=Vigna unguiculata TaxID=3917 RepID=A0A4D6NK93_VIGUN|nr:hypothetical protein DEO72_LG11g1202 [Vigna unguiculata]
MVTSLSFCTAIPVRKIAHGAARFIDLEVLCELSLRRRAPVLSESPSRSGEEVSPKRGDAHATVPLFSSPRLAKGAHLSERPHA